MMNLTKEVNGNEVKIILEGRLDTTTAPQVEAEVKALPESVQNLVFDFNNLEYISSAGLRVLLSAQKTMNKQGSMVIKNASESIVEVFDITGFSDILTVENN